LHKFVAARAAPRHFAHLGPVSFAAHVLCDGIHVRCGIADNWFFGGIADNGFFFRFGPTCCKLCKLKFSSLFRLKRGNFTHLLHNDKKGV
jgi:hypothetical protein